jgi:CRISPR system Cascade subunit CasD
LEDLKQALERPVFALYAGRKANALGLPVGPVIVEAESLAAAFALRPPRPSEEAFEVLDRLKPRNAWGREVAHDPLPHGIASGLTAVRSETRRDASPQRDRWQFAERTVAIGLLPQVGRHD